MMKRFLIPVLLLFFASGSFAQGHTCATSDPFCTGTIYNFPAGTTGYAEPGPYYGCLYTQPCPAWYHMRIGNPGSITIYMYSTPLHDIDFICWGPFTDPVIPCAGGLTASKMVDCCYCPDPEEWCDIPNGQTGEYYILLITNYSQQPCNITFSQTAGNGSTDCTILPPPVGNNGPLCVGQTLHLYADTIANATYFWSGPNGFLSTQQNPTIYNVTLANAGGYSCTITVGGQSSDPAVTTVIIYDLPNASLVSGDTTVCNATVAYILMSFAGWGPFTVTYTAGFYTYVATGLNGPVDTIFVYPTGPTTYTLTQVSDPHCSRTLWGMVVFVDTYPLTTGTLSGTGNICAGEQAQLLFNVTGTPPWTIVYTENGSNPQTIIANSTPYYLTVNPAVTTLYAFSSLEDIYCDGAFSGEALITVKPKPQANAGNDLSIPYGTTTTLNGQVVGGSGSYQYHWEPANKLVDANILIPLTINLTETTLFTLTATDNDGGCQDMDQVLVTVTGGALGCNPLATPSVLCFGESSQLQSMASGGSGSYSYTWLSDPPGFFSDLQNPVVIPGQTTNYMVTIDDGYNIVDGNVTVTVNALPVPNAGTDQTIPHGTYTTLDGSATSGTGYYSYHWEPADLLSNPNSPHPQTINLVSTTLFTLSVTDVQTGCICGETDQVTVIISGDALSANPGVLPEQICSGESAQLFALAGGGSGNYNYSWTSNPAGFTSTSANPVISPQVNTVYSVVVNDGFNAVSGSVGISVSQTPEVNLGPDKTVCVYDTVTLDAGNTGCSYIWSNGSTARTIKVGSTGIGFDIKAFDVIVTNLDSCQSTGTITIYFDFAACSGIGDLAGDSYLRIYPNPGDGLVNIELSGVSGEMILSVIDMFGREIIRNRLISFDLLKDTYSLDIQGYPEGVYLIRLLAERGRLITGKFLLLR